MNQPEHDEDRHCIECGTDLTEKMGVYVFVEGRPVPGLLCLEHGRNGANGMSLERYTRLLHQDRQRQAIEASRMRAILQAFAVGEAQDVSGQAKQVIELLYSLPGEVLDEVRFRLRAIEDAVEYEGSSEVPGGAPPEAVRIADHQRDSGTWCPWSNCATLRADGWCPDRCSSIRPPGVLPS